MYKNANRFLLFSAVFLPIVFITSLTQAQITSDRTVSTEVETVNNRDFTISGGTRTGDNLFHSFSEFSVPNNGLAAFENSADIQNIIGRVTGESISNIEGLIKAQGNANLLLINPNGIIFGSNARLDIGGSFLATTAESIHFTDGTQFAATDTQTTPLLTITTPIGLGFGETPGSIVSRARRINSDGVEEGLTVKTSKNLAFLGGEVLINGGVLSAPGGKIELGSVDSFSFVSLNLMSEGWTLGYETVGSFQNIHLSQATLGTNNVLKSMPNGDINLQGKAINITNSSSIQGLNFGTNPGGALSLHASDIVKVSKNSRLATTAFSSGAAGEINIITGRLLVSDGSSIITNSDRFFSLEGVGDGGKLNIDASESIEIRGEFTILATRTRTDGKAGDINLTTQRLILSDGGQVSSSTFREGEGGNLTVNASESIKISGQGNNLSNESGSGLFSQTSSKFATGNGGSIEINTGLLNVQDGGRISVAAVNGSQGEAGNLTITTQDITLDEGTLTAETNAGDRGNITIDNENNLLLGNNSQITTNAQGTATGGDITINSDIIAAVNNSDITANAVEGAGGDIKITSQLVGIEAREEESPNTNDITASSELGVDGTITIDNPKEDPLKSLLTVPSVPLDAARIFAQNVCKFEDGKIAKGSSFIITGRGGFVPTAADPIDARDRVVNWAKREDIKVSEDGSVAVRQRSERETLETSDRVIQQAQGLVIASDGTAWLTAESSNITLQNSGTDHPDCRS